MLERDRPALAPRMTGLRVRLIITIFDRRIVFGTGLEARIQIVLRSQIRRRLRAGAARVAERLDTRGIVDGVGHGVPIHRCVVAVGPGPAISKDGGYWSHINRRRRESRRAGQLTISDSPALMCLAPEPTVVGIVVAVGGAGVRGASRQAYVERGEIPRELCHVAALLLAGTKGSAGRHRRKRGARCRRQRHLSAWIGDDEEKRDRSGNEQIQE